SGSTRAVDCRLSTVDCGESRDRRSPRPPPRPAPRRGRADRLRGPDDTGLRGGAGGGGAVRGGTTCAGALAQVPPAPGHVLPGGALRLLLPAHRWATQPALVPGPGPRGVALRAPARLPGR